MPLVTISRLDALVLRVRHLDRALAWYAETLGLHPIHRDDGAGIAVLGVDGAPITLWQQGPGEPPDGPPEVPTEPHHPFPILAVEDAAAAQASLQAGGVAVTPLQEDLSVRWCTLSDPDGNVLEVCETIG